jgi:molybdopterin/thiamine biosynthesis adenylyltransferase
MSISQPNSLYNDRFKDAPWYKSFPNILIGGMGGIGSNTLYCLAKSIPGEYYIIDHDIVVPHNVGTQFFSATDVTKYKVDCMSSAMKGYAMESNIYPIKNRVDDSSYLPITIAAFDNMEARKFLFNIWKSNNDRELFIDGRLRSTMYQLFTVIPGREEEYEKTLFEDSEVDEGPCTFKQTTYFGMLIGARITQMIANYLSNRASDEDIAALPFCIEEVGEMIYLTTRETAL